MYELKLDGKTKTNITKVSFSKKEGVEDDIAKVEIVPSEDLNNITKKVSADIYVDGNLIFDGEYEGQKDKKEITRENIKELELRGEKLDINKRKVHRNWIKTDTGKIIREAIEERANHKSSEIVFRGEDSELNNKITTNNEYAQTYQNPKNDIKEVGASLVFAGWNSDSSVAAGDEIDVFKISDIISGYDGLNSIDIGLVGNLLNQTLIISWVKNDVKLEWEFNNIYREYRELELRPEEADRVVETSDDYDIGFSVNFGADIQEGEQNALAVDYIRISPFNLVNREKVDINTGNIENTGREVTRRFDTSIKNIIENLRKEDDYNMTRRDGESVIYNPRESGTTTESIDESSNIISIKKNQNLSEVDNEVRVQGQDEINAKITDSKAIDNTNLKAEKDVVGNQRTEREARDRAKGELERNATKKSTIEITIGNGDLVSLKDKIGKMININVRELSGLYEIEAVEVPQNGLVVVKVSEEENVS